LSLQRQYIGGKTDKQDGRNSQRSKIAIEARCSSKSKKKKTTIRRKGPVEVLKLTIEAKNLPHWAGYLTQCGIFGSCEHINAFNWAISCFNRLFSKYSVQMSVVWVGLVLEEFVIVAFVLVE